MLPMESVYSTISGKMRIILTQKCHLEGGEHITHDIKPVIAKVGYTVISSAVSNIIFSAFELDCAVFYVSSNTV